MQYIVDLDECTVSNPCGNGSLCTNTVGGYKCDCSAGLEYDYQNNVCIGKLKMGHKDIFNGLKRIDLVFTELRFSHIFVRYIVTLLTLS